MTEPICAMEEITAKTTKKIKNTANAPKPQVRGFSFNIPDIPAPNPIKRKPTTIMTIATTAAAIATMLKIIIGAITLLRSAQLSVKRDLIGGSVFTVGVFCSIPL